MTLRPRFQQSISIAERTLLTLVEIVGRIVGVHIDDVGTILYAGLSIDTAGVGRVVDIMSIIWYAQGNGRKTAKGGVA